MSAQPSTECNPFSQSREKFEEILAFLASAGAASLTHSELETWLAEEGRELLRMLYQGHIDARAGGPTAEPVIGADGTERRHVRTRERRVTTMFGPVTVTRLAYGGRGMSSLAPLDAQLNLPAESYSFGLRRKVALAAATTSFDGVVADVAEATGVSVPKRQVEELSRRATVDFDAFYEQRRPVADEDDAPILVLTTDGKGVVMRHEDLRPKAKRAAGTSRKKLHTRLSKGEKRNRKRMSQVAAVYTVKRFVRAPEDVVSKLGSVGGDDATVRKPSRERPRPQNKRVWASVKKDPGEVIGEMVAEALRRDPRKRKRWVVLLDGSEQQYALVHDALRSANVECTIILDIIHVLEYLWKASHAFFGDASVEGERWVTERLLRVLRGKVVHVAAGIRRSATLRGLTGQDRQRVDRCADYLLNNAALMRYDEYLADGLPIATGVIEGACRHLVKDRMDLTGARWGLEGAEAVLRLRALRASGDFEAYWRFHEAREYERNHASRYAANEPPATQCSFAPPRCRHLRLVE